MDKKEDISYQRLGEALFQRFRQLSTQRMGAAELWEQLAAHAVEQIDARRATLAAGTIPPGARPVGLPGSTSSLVGKTMVLTADVKLSHSGLTLPKGTKVTVTRLLNHNFVAFAAVDFGGEEVCIKVTNLVEDDKNDDYGEDPLGLSPGDPR